MRRNDRNVRIAFLYGLARQILHKRHVGGEIVGGRDRFRNRERHNRRHRFETPELEFVGSVDKIGVGEADPFAAPLQFKKDVVGGDDVAHRRPGEAFAVLADLLRAVDAGEHSRLSGRALRYSVNAETGVDGLGVLLEKTAKRRTNLRIERIVRRRPGKADSVNK